MRANKTLLIAGAAATAFGASAPAFAGGPGPAIVEPAPVIAVPPAPALTDWSGVYGGLSYGKTSGNIDNGGAVDFDDGSAPGLFLGYNFQNGPFVYGAELAYSKAQDTVLQGGTGDGLGSMAEIFGRAGYAAGKALFYGKVGYSMAKYDDGTTSTDFDGVAYGLGVDYLVTDNVFLGADYTRRDLSSDNSGDMEASTFGIRVGYKF